MARRNRKPGANQSARPASPPRAAAPPDLEAEAREATRRVGRRPPRSAHPKGLAALGPSGPGAPPAWASFILGEARYSDQAFASRQPHAPTADRWAYFPDRRLRYDVFWGHYEGNVYRVVHRWAEALKEDRQLYAYIRTIFSPAYRIGEFWAAHLWGGPLDPEAGDGRVTPSCLPVEIPEEAPKRDELRAALAWLFDYSSWQSRKDTVTRTGAVKGDVAMIVHDDGRSVSVRVVDPSTIADARRDSRGNVKEYVIQEWRPDPEADRLGPFDRRQCQYTEWCRRVGGMVVYTTYRDGVEYDWREYEEGTPEGERVGPTWAVEYDFIPMVLIQHRDMGRGWGWSELQPDFGKLYELDDLASKLSDQIRKAVDCPVYVAGASPGDVAIEMGDGGDGSDGSGRTRTPTIYGPEGSTATPLIADLDIAAVGAHIRSILEDLERDHPELATDNVGLASSGEARRVAREKVEANVVQRRAPYDDAFVRICQMAISMGAIKRYEGYEAFDEGSYDRGELDFSIGDRPVFAVDEADKLDMADRRVGIVQKGVQAGLPVAFCLKLAGIPDDEADEVMAMIEGERADAEKRAEERQQRMIAQMDGDAGADGGVDGNAATGQDDEAGKIPETIQ